MLGQLWASLGGGEEGKFKRGFEIWEKSPFIPRTTRTTRSNNVPRACPDTAAIKGFFKLVVSCDQDSINEVVYASENVRVDISFISAPAAKAFWDPVRTMQPM